MNISKTVGASETSSSMTFITVNICHRIGPLPIIIIIIIIMLAYFYCAAYTRITMYESSPTCEQRRITFNDDEQRVQLAQPELPAPHYIFRYRLLPTTPPSPSRHYYPTTYCRYQFTDPARMDSLVAKADCTHITFAQGYYTIEAKGTGRK